MKRRDGLAAAAVAALALTWSRPARAQSRPKLRRVGVLYPGIDPGAPPPGATAAWKSAGWIEGVTLLIERRYVGWRMERMPELVDALLRRHGAELLIAVGPEAAAAAARATRTVPIVFSFVDVPIENGLIDSYTRPGRNATGLALLSGAEAYTKSFEFLRAAAPSARRLAILAPDLRRFTVSGAPLDLGSDLGAATRAQGFGYTIHFARQVEDVESALAEAAAARAQAITANGYSYIGAAARVAEFALCQQWVSSTFNPELLDAGLLIYYGPSEAEVGRMSRRSVQIADRILRGASPADIPVELPTRYELALNLKTARAPGLKLPPSLLLRAERVIE